MMAHSRFAPDIEKVRSQAPKSNLSCIKQIFAQVIALPSLNNIIVLYCISENYLLIPVVNV